jgi:hypothetical protein
MPGCGSLAQDQATDIMQPVYVLCSSTEQEPEGCCDGTCGGVRNNASHLAMEHTDLGP